MKKYIVVMLLLSLLSSPLTYATKDNPSNTNNASNETNETKQTFTSDLTTEFAFDGEEDEFDALIAEAIEHNVVDENAEPPKQSKLKVFCAKVGIVLFLRPYIFLVTKYLEKQRQINLLYHRKFFREKGVIMKKLEVYKRELEQKFYSHSRF